MNKPNQVYPKCFFFLICIIFHVLETIVTAGFQQTVIIHFHIGRDTNPNCSLEYVMIDPELSNCVIIFKIYQ